jgi:uncharacterized protein YutE (UPF0331/DUF86 family)
MKAKPFGPERSIGLNRYERLLGFIEETVTYFLSKVEGVDRDRYFAERDVRNILDKTINDIILCVVDIAEECLKARGRKIPDTYKDTILACHELLGDITLKIAPLVKRRKEAIHHYLKVNWQNIVAVRTRIPEIKEFADKARTLFASLKTGDS